MKSEPDFVSKATERESGLTLRETVELIRDRETKLRESEERFRATFEQAAVGITHVSPDGHFLRVNDRFCDIVGYRRDEILSLTFQDITHPDDLETDLDHARRLLRGESDNYSTEKRYFRKDGGTVWVKLTATVLKDDAGKPRWFVSVVEDITEKKKAQQERDRILTLSQDLICIAGMDGCLKYVNPAWERFLGYADEELLTKPFLDFVHPDDRKRTARELESLAAGQSTFDFELRGVAKDGTISHISWVVTPLADEDLIYCIGRDVTERKEAEKAVRESRRRLIKAQNVARMGFMDWNLKTNEIVWSREVYDLYGIDPKTPVTIEQTVALVHPDDLEFVNKNLDMAIHGTRDYDIDHRLVRPDGKVIWVHARADLDRDSEGTPIALMGTVVDITERKRAEEEARRHRDALARVDRATSLGQLTGSIAHELNQPLTGILSNAQAAELLINSGQWEREELAEIMAEIVADTKRGGEVIQNLRELYREQKGELLPIDINAVVQETTHLLHSEFVIQRVELSTECASTVPVVNGNRIQIQQVLVNLIMNGIQAMDGIARENRRLHIATAREMNKVKVWIDDDGRGIDTDKIDRIFEPLATWKPGGTGMGLAISNSIIQSHGGRMWAENRPEGGARVGFALLVQKEGELL